MAVPYVEMNTDYALAKIIIDGVEYLSGDENTRIDSVTITTGAYDGNVVGVGCVYGARCFVQMQTIRKILIGSKVEVYFKIKDKWVLFGRFKIKTQPAFSDDLMSFEAEGTIGFNGDEYFYAPGMYYLNRETTIGELLNGITETSDMSKIVFDIIMVSPAFLKHSVVVSIRTFFTLP